jgi:hypothetical protein
MILKQKRGGIRKEFEIISDSELRIKEKESGVLKEWSVSLDSIGHNLIYSGSTRKGLYFLACFFALYPIVTTIALFIDPEGIKGNFVGIIIGYLVSIVLIILMLYVPLKKDIYLVGGEINLTFFQDRPSKQEVSDFISELIRLSKQSLIKKYARIDSDLPEDVVMNQFNWLKNKDLITEKEYIELKNAYKKQRLINKR